MVLVDRFYDLYQAIKEKALEGASTVLILAAPDVDGVCACRVLTYMLRSDNVSYTLRPVEGYTQVGESLGRLGTEHTDVKSVIMINCGAIVNVASLLPWECEDVTCYVIDSHRPVHLANIYDAGRVFVIRNEEEELPGDLPSDGEGLSGGEESSDEEDEDEEEAQEKHEQEQDSDMDSEDEADLEDVKNAEAASDDEDEQGQDVGESEEGVAGTPDGDGSDREGSQGGSPAPRKRLRRAREGGGSDGEEQEDDGAKQDGEQSDLENTVLPPLEAKEQEEQRERASRKRQREEVQDRHRRITQYYMGAYYGAPSAFVMHRLCQELNRDTRDTLWLSCVGLTDLLVHRRIDHDQYVQLVESLECDVVQMNERAHDIESFSAADGTMVPSSQAGRIESDMDYQFMLYRHWSLYESMFHSDYVAAKLLLWWSQGRKRLDELLARMGFSLLECREKYKFMDPDLKARLRAELDRLHEEFGLDDVFFLSFVRHAHYGATLSASDVVYAVAALLEAGQVGVDAQAQQRQEAANEEDRVMRSRFWDAYDALSGQEKGNKRMQEGIQLAMALQQAIFSTAMSMQDKRAVRNLSHFRWAVIHNNLASAEDQLLTQPLAISRLATLITDVSREDKARHSSRSGWQPKPLIMFAERRGTFLVVGVPCPEQRGEVVKHRFAQLFRLAAEGCKARYRHDGFDSAVLELDKDSVQRFTESLYLAMDAGTHGSGKQSRRR